MKSYTLLSIIATLFASQALADNCFAEKLGFKCCSYSTMEVYSDKNGKWSVESNEWCGINPNASGCWANALGYRCCKSTKEVIATDKDGEWSIEDGHWCGIPKEDDPLNKPISSATSDEQDNQSNQDTTTTTSEAPANVPSDNGNSQSDGGNGGGFPGFGGNGGGFPGFGGGDGGNGGFPGFGGNGGGFPGFGGNGGNGGGFPGFGGGDGGNGGFPGFGGGFPGFGGDGGNGGGMPNFGGFGGGDGGNGGFPGFGGNGGGFPGFGGGDGGNGGFPGFGGNGGNGGGFPGFGGNGGGFPGFGGGDGGNGGMPNFGGNNGSNDNSNTTPEQPAGGDNSSTTPETQPTQPEDNTQTTQPTTPGAGAGASSVDCSGKSLKSGTTLTIGGRKVIVKFPNGFSGDKPAPLLINYHPIMGSASQWEGGSQTAKAALNDGAIVAFMDGAQGPMGQAWNVGPCCTDADDVKFTRDFITEITSKACVDPKRIYAAGFSMGGGMSNYAGCFLSDVIAAAAPSAFDLAKEIVDGGKCKPARPFPILNFRGTQDNVVMYNGGLSQVVQGKPITFMGAKNNLKEWAKMNGCTGEPKANTPGNNCEMYENCKDGVKVGLCTINGGGHSEGDGKMGWDFVKQFSLP